MNHADCPMCAEVLPFLLLQYWMLGSRQPDFLGETELGLEAGSVSLGPHHLDGTLSGDELMHYIAVDVG